MCASVGTGINAYVVLHVTRVDSKWVPAGPRPAIAHWRREAGKYAPHQTGGGTLIERLTLIAFFWVMLRRTRQCRKVGSINGGEGSRGRPATTRWMCCLAGSDITLENVREPNGKKDAPPTFLS